MRKGFTSYNNKKIISLFLFQWLTNIFSGTLFNLNLIILGLSYRYLSFESRAVKVPVYHGICVIGNVLVATVPYRGKRG